MRAPKVGVSAADEVGVVIEDVLVVVVELQVGVVDSIIIVLKDHMTLMRKVTAEIRSSNLVIFWLLKRHTCTGDLFGRKLFVGRPECILAYCDGLRAYTTSFLTQLTHEAHAPRLDNSHKQCRISKVGES